MHEVERDWTAAAGLRAVVLKIGHEASGEWPAWWSHRSGYVQVPEGHPLYGVPYSEPVPGLDAEEYVPEWSDVASPEAVLTVHGGITYAADDGDYPVEGGGWWLGFDALHAGDGTIDVPPYATPGDIPDNVTRSLDYMAAECELLAEQIVKVGAAVEGE